MNEISSEDVQPGQLVRFRCMIQDMYDPEYFMPTFSREGTMLTSLFRDRFDEDIVEEEDEHSRPMDRTTWHCIGVPAENEWVNAGYKQSDRTTTTTINKDTDMEMQRGQEEMIPTKKTKYEDDKHPRSFCFPLPTCQKRSCIVKVYTEDTQMKVNDVIEVVGILSHFPDVVKECEAEKNGFCGEEFYFKNPPSSVVPRIHAVFYKKIPHQNPLLGYHIEEGESAIIRRRILDEATRWREELLAILQQAFLGDRHSAEYVLLHLISRVYVRHDVLPLGKFSLNVQNANAEMAKLFAELFACLVTKSHFVEMSLAFLNGTKFVPNKDYNLNRLQSGLLQLSDGTHLICDENALDAGQLTSTGVDNVKALGTMIQHQSVQYNFGFHQMEFHTDVPVLYVSEGKGLIRCDFQVKVHPVEPMSSLPQAASTIKERLTEELLINLRRYITIVKLLDHKLNEEMQRTVQEDFVSMRATSSAMTADDLHNLLVVARYVALSRGEMELTVDSWEHAKKLEAERHSRCT